LYCINYYPKKTLLFFTHTHGNGRISKNPIAYYRVGSIIPIPKVANTINTEMIPIMPGGTYYDIPIKLLGMMEM